MKKLFIGCGVAATLLVLCGLYYTLSPLFITVHLDESVPESAVANPQTEALMYKAEVVGTLGHPGAGTVSVIDTQEGKVLRYENFKTANGPDLFVYLSTDKEATEFVNLGGLKATEGNVNYTIPPGTDLSKYRYALVWCKQFGVLFNYAEFHKGGESTPEKKENMMENNETKSIMTKEMQHEDSANNTHATAIFANGCFWCVEHDLEKVTGVIDVVSGYAGGSTENPTYENYHDGGHREVVKVTYDRGVVSYGNLVEHILKHGDPTDADGSFYDRGVYYAPALYYKNETEKQTAEELISAVDALQVFEKKLAIAVLPEARFWPAEEYHQDYSEKNPLRYNYYRAGSGRTKFIEGVWGEEIDTFTISEEIETAEHAEKPMTIYTQNSWNDFLKPSNEELKARLEPLAYKVTQEEGTERSGTHPYDKNYEAGIYVDIVSGEPLFSSRDKYDSGTGWPSFVKPLSPEVVTLHEDKKLLSTRTEVRSAHADSHLGHVFDDGPTERGGKRYCMNGVALRFIANEDMEKEGYGYLLSEV